MSSPDESPAAVSPLASLDEHELLHWLKRSVDEHAIFAITDAHGVILHVNDRFCAISGYTRAELVGKTHRLIKSDVHPPSFFSEMWRTISSGEVWHGTICNRAKDGRLYWVESTIVPRRDSAGVLRGYLALRTDVTALKSAEDATAMLANDHALQSLQLRDARSQIQIFFDHAPIGLSWRDLRTALPGAQECSALALSAMRRGGSRKRLMRVFRDRN